MQCHNAVICVIARPELVTVFFFFFRQGAEDRARNLTLPAHTVRRSPSPMPAVMVSPTAAAGSNPKDATERRAMQSGTSFVTGQYTSHASLYSKSCGTHTHILQSQNVGCSVLHRSSSKGGCNRQHSASVVTTAVGIALALQASLSVSVWVAVSLC